MITGKSLVNACGSVLDSYQVEIPGHISDARQPSAPETFTLTLDVGTEYGGIPLEDSLTLNGADRGDAQIAASDRGRKTTSSFGRGPLNWVLVV